MDYMLIYSYRVRKSDRNEFLEVMRRAREVYRRHGGAGEELLLLSNRTSKYGLTGLWEVLPSMGDEDIWIGLDRYKNAEHCSKVMKKVDKDPETDPLYKRVVQLVSHSSRIVRGEFEKVDY